MKDKCKDQIRSSLNPWYSTKNLNTKTTDVILNDWYAISCNNSFDHYMQLWLKSNI